MKNRQLHKKSSKRTLPPSVANHLWIINALHLQILCGSLWQTPHNRGRYKNINVVYEKDRIYQLWQYFSCLAIHDDDNQNSRIKIHWHFEVWHTIYDLLKWFYHTRCNPNRWNENFGNEAVVGLYLEKPEALYCERICCYVVTTKQIKHTASFWNYMKKLKPKMCRTNVWNFADWKQKKNKKNKNRNVLTQI